MTSVNETNTITEYKKRLVKAFREQKNEDESVQKAIDYIIELINSTK